jgi:hypothetical protein
MQRTARSRRLNDLLHGDGEEQGHPDIVDGEME